MITFIVTKDDNTKTIEFSNDGTMLDLKTEIIKQFEVDCKYIDITSNADRPIRVLGKFNFDNSMLFSVFLVLWSLYGVFYFLDDIPKNVGFNVLDLFSKCFVGIFFWAYFTKVFSL